MPGPRDPAWVFNPAALEAALKAKGLTMSRLGTESGIAHPGIWKLMTGKTVDPTSSTLLSMAAALEVDPRTLMTQRW